MSVSIQDAGAQLWRIDGTDVGGYALTAIAGSGPTSILMQDQATGTIYSVTVVTTGGVPELTMTVSAGSPTTVAMTSPDGQSWLLLIINGAWTVEASTPPPPPPSTGVSDVGRPTHAFAGRGTRIFMSADGVKWKPIAQLKTFVPQGSKQQIVDQTNILTPDNFTRQLAARVDSGDISMSGVLDPTNSDILQLGVAHANLAAYFFKVVLTDGTEYDFQALVSEYVPFGVEHNKFIGFSAKLRVTGAFTGPAGSA